MNNLEKIRDLLNKSCINRNTKNEIFNHLGAVALVMEDKDEKIDKLKDKLDYKNVKIEQLQNEIRIYKNMIKGAVSDYVSCDWQ